MNIRTRSGDVESRLGVNDYCDYSLVVGIAGNSIGPLYEYSREYYSAGHQDYNALIFALGTYLYSDEDAPSNDVVQITASLSSSDIYCLNVFDHLFVANGADDVMTWDGNNWYKAGIDKPAAAPTGAYAAGALNGYRRYKYTYYRPASVTNPYEKESEASDVFTAIGAGGVGLVNEKVTLTLVAPGDAQATHFRIYATATFADLAVPETDYYLRATQVIGTTTLEDNVADADLIDEAPYDTTYRDVPPEFKYMLWEGNRIYGAGVQDDPSIIYYSVIGKPFYYSQTYFWDEVGRDDGSIITGLASIGITRFIFKENSIYQWTGDPESATPIRAVERPDASQNMNRIAIGCTHPRSIASWSNSIIFRAGNGHVYMLTLNELIQLSMYIETDIQTLGDDCTAAIFDDYYIISDGDVTIVCDLNKGVNGWEGFDTQVDPFCFCVDHNGYLLGTEGDQIKRYYNGANDDGVDITKIFQSSYAHTYAKNDEGAYRRVYVRSGTRSSVFTIGVFGENESLIANRSFAADTIYCSLGRCRGLYGSVRLTWTGSEKINGIDLGYFLRKRH